MARKRLNPTKTGTTDPLNRHVSDFINGKKPTETMDSTGSAIDQYKARSWRMRQVKQYYDQIVSDLGGHDNLSFAQSEMAKRAAVMAVMGSEMETGFVTGDEDFDMEDYIILSRAQQQILKSVGFKRVAKPVKEKGEVRTLDDYLERKKR